MANSSVKSISLCLHSIKPHNRRIIRPFDIEIFMLVIQKSPINVSKLNEFEQEEEEEEEKASGIEKASQCDRKTNKQNILLIIIIVCNEWTWSKISTHTI